MTLVLGSLTLKRVRAFRIITSVKIPRHDIVGKATGTTDPDCYVRDPDEFELIVEVNDTDRQTLQDTYLNTFQTLTDSAIGFSETVQVEKVECEAQRGYGASSLGLWVCSIGLVISNS